MWKVVAGSALGLGAYCYCKRPAQDIIASVTPAVFSVLYVDEEEKKTKLMASGFFINEDGIGITSGPQLRSLKGAKVSLRLRDGRVLDADPVLFEEAPGIGFINAKSQVEGEKFPFIPTVTKPGTVRAGDHVYTLGFLANHLFFNRLYVTDIVHPGGMKAGEALMIIDTFRMTGQVADVCMGGPMLDEEGKAVGVMINIEAGNAVAVPLSYIEKLREEQKPSLFQTVVQRFKEAVYLIVLGDDARK